MKRPNIIQWVSTTNILYLLVMWQGHVLASAITPLNYNAQIVGTFQDSIFSRDFADAGVETSEGEYPNFFPEDSVLHHEEADYTISTSTTKNDEKKNRNLDAYDSIENYSLLTAHPNKLKNESLNGSYNKQESTESSTISHNHLSSTSFIAKAQQQDSAEKQQKNYSISKQSTKEHNKKVVKSVLMDHLIEKLSRFNTDETITSILSDLNISLASPDTYNTPQNHNDDSGKSDMKRVQNQNKTKFFPHSYIGKRNISYNGQPTTIDTKSLNTVPLSFKNHNQHKTAASAHILLPEFPYMMMTFPYAQVDNSKKESKIARINPQNNNEEKISSDSAVEYAKRGLRFQRRNKRETLKNIAELTKDVVNDETEKLVGNDHTEDPENFEENSQHKSIHREEGLLEKNNSVNEGEIRESVRDNTTSRPPTPSNPIEVLQKLTRLLDRMLRELSLFGQKFTLRLIRMTERQDIDQMQEIMKDFDISPDKPIFFIAGGLKKLNRNDVLRVTSSSPVEVTTNFPENATNYLNETSIVDQSLQQHPVSNASHVEVVQEDIDDTTMVPILKPSEISPLPVESNANEQSTEEIISAVSDNIDSTTEALSDYNNEFNKNDSLLSSPTQPLPLRAKRAIPQFEEFSFFPIPGRSARTENPYDEDDEGFDLTYNYAQVSGSIGANENSKHPTSIVPESSVNVGASLEKSIPAGTEMIDQSQSKKNDDMSLNEYNDITGYVSSEYPSTLRTTTNAPSLPKSEAIVSYLSEPIAWLHDTNAKLLPPNSSIMIKEKVVETGESNDHHHQGEQNIQKMPNPNMEIETTVGETKNSHVEKYIPKEDLPGPEVPVVVKNADGHTLAVSNDGITSQIAFLEDKKPIRSLVDEKLKADEMLNLSHEIPTEHQRRAGLDGGNYLQINKSPSSLLFETANSPSDVHFYQKKSDDVVSSELPIATLQTVEKSIHSNITSTSDKQNVTQNVSLRGVMPTKERIENGNQQPVSSELNAEESSDDAVLSMNDDSISATKTDGSTTSISTNPEKSTLAPEILLSKAQADQVNETILIPGESEKVSVFPKSSTETHRLSQNISGNLNLVSKLGASSSADDPQDEIKVTSTLPQANILLEGSGISIPVGVTMIKEGLPLSSDAEKVSVTPTELSFVQQRTKPTSQTTAIFDTIPAQEPVSLSLKVEPTDSILESTIAPILIQAEDSTVLYGSTREKVDTIESSLGKESSRNENQTRNKQQSFTLSKNQANLVGEQNDLVGDMKKVGGAEKGDKIGEEKVQFSSNQANFRDPTAVKESQIIISNNNATFLLDDKASTVPFNVEPIHSTETVDSPDTTTVDEKTTDTVRYTEALPVQNSKTSGSMFMKESTDVTIVASNISDKVEVRNPIGTSITSVPVAENENIDLRQQSRIKEDVVEVPLFQELPTIKNVSLSKTEVSNPFAKSVETVISKDKLNIDSLSKNVHSVGNTSVPSSSTTVDALHEKTFALNNSNERPVLAEEANQAGITYVADVASVNDLPKLVQNVPQPEIKTEPFPTNASNYNITETVPVVEKLITVDAPLIVSFQHSHGNAKPISSEVKAVEIPETPENASVKASILSPSPQVKSTSVPFIEASKVASGEKVNVMNSSHPHDILEASSIDVDVEESAGVGEIIKYNEPHIDKDVIVESLPKAGPESGTNGNMLSLPVGSIVAPNITEDLNKQTGKESIKKGSLVYDQLDLPLPKPNSEALKPLIEMTAATNPSASLDTKSLNEMIQNSSIASDKNAAPQDFIHDIVTDSIMKSPIMPITKVESTSPSVNQGLQINDSAQFLPLKTVAKPLQETDLEHFPVQSIAAPMVSKDPSKSGDENIIANLPVIDPDSGFVVKPIDTQPHYQIPGLRPSIPERPHPDYLGSISQGVDIDSLIFSPPTTPVIVTSPPVFSGYSQASILRKQEQMMKNYFNGLLFRRALAV